MTPLDSAVGSGPVTARLRDGTSVVLRGVQPEDQLLLQELLESCSPTSLYRRFHYVTKRLGELASRFCDVEGKHEKVIVAEIESEGTKKLIGFGDLAAETLQRSVEVAVLVADRWQGLGLGSALADYCLDVVCRGGVKEIVAVTTPDNRQVIEMAQRRGFRIQWQLEDRILALSKKLHPSRTRRSGEAA